MQFTGGLRYGPNAYLGCNVTWPFAKLTAESGFLSVTDTCFKRAYSFEKNQIKRLSKYWGLFISPGIRIEHTVDNYPSFIVFWTFSQNNVKSGLIEMGYAFG